MNLRALQFAVIELMRSIIANSPTVDVFNSKLTKLSKKNILADHWIKNRIRPVFMILMHLRAEREGDFALCHLKCKLMLPYFFAALHWNYARDGIVYLSSLEKSGNILFN